MPKELKKRGRRAEKQARSTNTNDNHRNKRRKIAEEYEHDFDISGEAGDDFINFGQVIGSNKGDEEDTTFYGLLTEEEQQYYSNVNAKINAHDFEDSLDQVSFIEAVHRETANKEIKVASSQSCSRYLEKVIRLSTAKQLRALFLAFLQDIDYLVQHRFGSHCVQTLFSEASKYVEFRSITVDESSTSFETLFLEAAAKLQRNGGYLITEKFASHTIRVLLLVLSGLPLEDAAAKDIIASRKKENVEISQITEPLSVQTRKIPDSFRRAWQDFVQSSISGLDTTYLQALATSPLGSPMLQLFLRMELSESLDKDHHDRYLLQRLIPSQKFEPESEESKFVSGLVYDASGAYLVQILVRYLPGKSFKRLYKNLFKTRVGKLAKNDIASYVATSIFERIGKEDLTDAVEKVIPELTGLVKRNRLAVIRSLLERSEVRGANLEPMREAFLKIYGHEPGQLLTEMLHLDSLAKRAGPEATNPKVENSTTSIQSSLLAQSMLRCHAMSDLIQDGLREQSDSLLKQMAQDPSLSRVIQAALVSDVCEARFLRQFVPRFYNLVPDLAIDPSGSHVVDALWTATKAIHFMKERIARVLQNNETRMRESVYGRRVWKNWAMDLYQRRPAEWQATAKDFDKKSQDNLNRDSPKAGIELARERFMKKQMRKDNKNNDIVAELIQEDLSFPSYWDLRDANVNHPILCRSLFAQYQYHSPIANTSNEMLHSSFERGAQLGEGLKRVIPELLEFINNADIERAQHHRNGSLETTERQSSLVHPLSSCRTDLEQVLASILFFDERGTGFEGLQELVKMILTYSVNTSAPGFLDKLYAAPLPPGIVAELVLGILNTNVHVYQVSPVLTLIEKHVTKALSRMFGFDGPRSGGISLQGGSASNMTSIVIARNTLYPETKMLGNSAVKGQLLLYTSAHGHYSVEKAAQALGLGSSNVILVPVNTEGQMKPDELLKLVRDARNNGHFPFFINATAGTTVLGSFDPFEAISKIAKEYSMWLHIDGAWGGSFIFSNNAVLKSKLNGSEFADSIAVNAHKMLGTPVTCSFLLGSDMRTFQTANTLRAGYLFHDEYDEDDDNHESGGKKGSTHMHENQDEDWNEPYDVADQTLQCGRRGDSLKLFLCWKYYGTQGYAQMVDTAYDIACKMLEQVNKNPNLTPVLRRDKPSCLQVCFYFTLEGKFTYGLLGQTGHIRPQARCENNDVQSSTLSATYLGKLNSQVTASIAKTLVDRGFMIDFAPALEGQEDRGSFFRVVVNISTISETIHRLIDELVTVGISIVKEQKFGTHR